MAIVAWCFTSYHTLEILLIQMKKIFIGLLAIIIIIQFFRIDKTNAVSDPSLDLFTVEVVPDEVQSLLKTACFDCHSNTAVYPWYTNVAPVSWWIKRHIDEGRDELNFNDWGSYSVKRKRHKLEEIEEMIDEKEMPLPSYLWIHGEARLTEREQKELIRWSKQLRAGAEIEEL